MFRTTRLLALALASLAATKALADDFDRLEGRALADLPKSELATAHQSLTVAELATLPRILSGIRSSVVVVVTDQGNPARLLIEPAFRKPSTPDGAPVPILIVERFDTFEAGPATTKLARGQDLVLFDGYRLDLDTGQVVPEGQGGDLQFVAAEKPTDQKLVAIDPARLYTLNGSPLSDVAEPGKPSPGRAILPGDFAGRYRLVANGQWSGTLELEIDAQGVVRGRFRSDQTGSSYRVSGQLEDAESQLIRFDVVLPRARQEFEGRLFTEGKNAIAGSMSLLGRTYGFFATREGASVVPEGLAAGTPPVEAAPEAIVIEVGPDGPIRLGGEETTLDHVGESIGDPTAAVRIRARPDTPYSRVAELIDRLRDAGLSDIRLESTKEAPKP